MKILALEYSGSQAALAVMVEGELVCQRSCAAPRGRGSDFFQLLQETRSQWEGLDRVAVGLGPGSYNGLRVVCAAAEALREARGCEAVGLSSACLLPSAPDEYGLAGDARGGRFYWAVVRQRRLVGDIRLLAPDELRTVSCEEGKMPAFRAGELPGFEDWPEVCPSAAVLALEAATLPAWGAGPLEPLYLKPPHITAPRGGLHPPMGGC